jgi:hypothetical protein
MLALLRLGTPATGAVGDLAAAVAIGPGRAHHLRTTMAYHRPVAHTATLRPDDPSPP